jgi:hypothetical protein
MHERGTPMSTITHRLMHARVAAMRDLLAASAEDAAEPAVAADATAPLAAHLPTVDELATAVVQDDGATLGRRVRGAIPATRVEE